MSTFSITINVSPKKIIGKGRRTFGKLSKIMQQKMLHDNLYYAIESYQGKVKLYQFVFEDTKQGYQHMHALLLLDEDINQEEYMYTIQNKIHRNLGMPKLDPAICCYWERTVVNEWYFTHYMSKEHDVTIMPQHQALVHDGQAELDEVSVGSADSYDELKIKITKNLFSKRSI